MLNCNKNGLDTEGIVEEMVSAELAAKSRRVVSCGQWMKMWSPSTARHWPETQITACRDCNDPSNRNKPGICYGVGKEVMCLFKAYSAIATSRK